MHRRAFLHATGLLSLGFIAGCATPAAPTASGPRFSETERKAIVDHYARQRGRGPTEVPPQTVKAGDKLAQGPRRRRLPRELEDALPTLSHPHMRLIVGADVVLVNTDTDDILDVIPRVAY